jgi:hypothetical protein
MNTALQTPSAESVKAACERFDRENQAAEHALNELFHQYPHNTELSHVLLKVVAVNSLYHTYVFDVNIVARHIHSNIPGLDSALAAGSHEIIHQIAKVNVNGKAHNFYSFATKFCSWHNPDAYPIYDSRIDHYLWDLQQHNHFASFNHPDLWDYPKFHKIMTAFRDFHGLASCTVKDLDKFLDLQRAPLPTLMPDHPHTGPGAFDYYPAEELTS